MFPRDTLHSSTTGAALARSAPAASAAASQGSPTGWTVPTGIPALLVGVVIAVVLLFYWDRRIVK